MADGEVLKRLGGGRWKTADERFTVEPQSGSWVVIDAQQTDDLGLPLVRGPFASLTAARAAIHAARTGATPISPLAARVEEERLNLRPARPAAAKVGSPAAARASAPTPQESVTKERPRPPEPPPPPEPAWIGELPVSRRPTAWRLIEHLTDAGIPNAEDVARAEVAGGEPAVARIALVRHLQGALARGTDRAALVAEILAAVASGEDPDLQVRWRLVDGEGRPMAPLPTLGPGGTAPTDR